MVHIRRLWRCGSVFFLLALILPFGPAHSQEALDPAFGGGSGTVVYNGGNWERGNAVTVDSAGNIYVAGSADNRNAFLTLKYNSAGTLLWSKTFTAGGDAGEATAVAVDDATGDVYVGGAYDGGWLFIVVKYDSSGNQYGKAGTPVSGTAFGRDGSNNGAGNGDSDGNGTLDYFMWAYNQWAGYSYLTGMIRDAATGDLTLTGWDDDGGGTLTAVTLKINSNGQQYGTDDHPSVSGTAFGNSSTWDGGINDEAIWDLSGTDYAYAIARNPVSGGFYVAGESNGSPLLIKYNSNGALAGSFGNTDYDGNAVNDTVVSSISGTALSVAVDASGNPYVAGYSTSGPSNAYLALNYTSAGVGVEPFGNTDLSGNSVNDAVVVDGAGDDRALAIALDGVAETFLVTGYYSSGGVNEIRTYKFSTAAGSQLWSATFSTPGLANRGNGIALGSIVVAGTYHNGTNEDVRVIKYALFAPADPSALVATAASSSQINLTWTDNSNNEDGFRVERSLDGVSFVQIASVGENATSYSNTGLSGSTTYYYRVRAYNEAGNSGYAATANATTSAPAVVAPVAPSALLATVVSSARTDLVWTDNSNNEDGFRVERSLDGITFTEIAAVLANVAAYSDTGLTASTVYVYRVRATNSVGNSAYTNAVSATTSGVVSVSSTAGNLTNVQTLPSTSPIFTNGFPGAVSSFPVGFFTFRVTGLSPGTSTQITLTLTAALPADHQWYWYNPTTDIWRAVPSSLISTSDNRVFVVTLTDGGFGDADGRANGIIDDPLGPAVLRGSSGGGRCGSVGLDLLLPLGLAWLWRRRRRFSGA